MEPPIPLLLIEDNPGDARLIEIMVREIDQPTFALDWADCLAAAWQLMARNAYQGILLDLHLPDSQGIRTFEKVAQYVPHLPVVVLTGMDDLQLAIQLVREGAQDYLVKGQINSGLLSKAIQYAIERKRTELELQRINRALRTLSDCNQILVSAANEVALLQSICRTIVEVGGYSLAWVGYAEEGEEKKVKPVTFFGLGEELLEGTPISWGDNEWGQGPCGVAIRTNSPAVVRDRSIESTADPWCQEALKLGLRSALSLPLREGERAFGALTICSQAAETFDAEEISLLSELAGDLAYGILSLRVKIERDRGLEALRESEERLQRVINATQDGIWEWDIESNREFFSPRWCEILGYSFDDLELPHTFDAWASRIHPNDHDRVIEAQKSHLEKGSKYDVEYRHRHRSGEYRWQNSRGQAVLDEQGKPIKMVGCISDITERMQAEEALRNRESMLQRIFDILPVGLWFADKDGMLLRGNLAGVKIWGAEPKVGSSEYGIFKGRRLPSGEEVAAADWALAHTIKDRVTIVDELLEIDAFDGKKKKILNYTAPVLDAQGDVQGAIVVNQDITERMQAEETLLREQTMLARTEGIANIGSWEWDIATDTVIWSDELFRIFQRDPREGAPSFAEHPAFYHPEGMARLQQAVEAAVALGTPYELELQAIRKDGETRECVARGVVEMTPGGRAVRLFGSLQDITERKRLEQETAKAHADFLFAVSHELKTPLLVLGATQEMVEALPEEQRVEHFRAYDTIWKRNLVRLRHIIENLVDSQRPPGIGSKLEKRLISLADTATEVIADLEPIAFAKEVTLTLKAEPLPDLPLDPHAWTRLLENLLTNAIKFSHTGGEVTLRIRRAVGNVEMAVIDHGIGISPQAMPFLFELFYRSPEALKAGVQGTGLGLYVVKLIAEAHGGSVEVESEVGKGTTVTVRLPLLEEDQ